MTMQGASRLAWARPDERAGESVPGADNAHAPASADDGRFFGEVPRLELDQLLEQLRDRAGDVLATQGRLRGLLRANAAVAADLSAPLVLHRIVDAACELLGARYAAIGIVGSDGTLVRLVRSGAEDDVVPRPDEMPWGTAILNVLPTDATLIPLGEPGAIHTSSAEAPKPNTDPASFLGVPIRVGDELFGNLYLTERIGGGQFTDDDRQLASALAATAGGAIANARLFTESEQRRRWLDASAELTSELLSAGVGRPLELITREAAKAADADFAVLVLPDGDDRVIVRAVSGDLDDDLVGRSASRLGSLSGRAIRSGEPTLVADYRSEADEIGMAADVGPVLVVPLVAAGHTRGALTLGRYASRVSYTPADLILAAFFGIQTAVTLELADARDVVQQEARVEDRERIAGDLHDHVIKELFALGMGLQGLASVTKRQEHVDRINDYVRSLDRVVNTIRTTIFQIQRHRLGATGLQARILNVVGEQTPQLGYSPQIHFTGPLDLTVQASLADDIVAVTREGLSNCARHAQASSVDVSLVLTQRVITLKIVDNGHGIGTATRSSGLTNMRRLAEQHGGSFTVIASDAGGTALTWTASIDS
jgi:signal transduction histidine kinase